MHVCVQVNIRAVFRLDTLLQTFKNGLLCVAFIMYTSYNSHRINSNWSERPITINNIVRQRGRKIDLKINTLTYEQQGQFRQTN